MKKVLLVTDGFFHPSLLARKALRNRLSKLEGYTFTQIRSLEKLPADLDSYAALVIYVHHKRISKTALAKLDSFVAAGGGLLGIHTATASFKKEANYFKILGGRFTGHGPVEKFSITPEGRTDVFRDISAFDVVDELYIHELQSEIEVHFIAIHKGEKIPVVWTYSYGNGRVVYAVPGHTTETIKNNFYQKLLEQGLKWVTNG